MDIKRHLARLAIVGLAACGLSGCGSKSPSESEPGGAASGAKSEASSTLPVDHLKVARQKLLLQEFDAAADAAYKALVQDPNGLEATLVAAQVEAGRGNYEIAIDLASTVDRKSGFGKDAVEVESSSLAKRNRLSEAADVLIEGLIVMPEVSAWRHRAWELLNRVGRREEASAQAETLCIEGQASQQELLSLIRRAWSFPFSLEDRRRSDEGI